jgi:multidrug efflux pump subunit AcrB
MPGLIRLHMRMPTGTRIEETARMADQVETVIREIMPAKELGTVLDNLGLPYSGINLSYSNAGTIGTWMVKSRSRSIRHGRPLPMCKSCVRNCPSVFPALSSSSSRPTSSRRS